MKKWPTFKTKEEAIKYGNKNYFYPILRETNTGRWEIKDKFYYKNGTIQNRNNK